MARWALASALVLVGCMPGLSVLPRLAASTPLSYRAYVGAPAETDRFASAAVVLMREAADLRAEDLMRRSHELIAAVPMPAAFPGSLSVRRETEDRLRVELFGDARPTGREERGSKGGVTSWEVTPILSAEISRTGEPVSFFLPRGSHALLSMVFRMPNDAVSVGDSWQIPAAFLELVGGYRAIDSFCLRRATLLGVDTRDDGTRVARILHVAAEGVSGSLHASAEAEPEAFSGRVLYVGYGDFSLTEGAWIDYRARLWAGGEGAAAFLTRDVLYAFEALPG